MHQAGGDAVLAQTDASVAGWLFVANSVSKRRDSVWIVGVVRVGSAGFIDEPYGKPCPLIPCGARIVLLDQSNFAANSLRALPCAP